MMTLLLQRLGKWKVETGNKSKAEDMIDFCNSCSWMDFQGWIWETTRSFLLYTTIGSAFSKPILPPSSSLVSPRGGGGSVRNGSAFGNSTTPSSLHPAASVAAAASAAAAAHDANSSNSNPKNTDPAAADAVVKYKECLRNHAAAIGGHVVDGCGEFMPNGSPSTPEALKCAACGCHRSFHRKDAEDGEYHHHHHHLFGGGAAHVPLLLPPPLPPLAHPHYHGPSRAVPPVSPSGVMASGGTTTESSSEERIHAGGVTAPGSVMRKRFRTKFTPEQKEKMQAFAERIGWRIQKQEEALVEQFCADAGVKRHVLKVWMHNNKHANKKQQQPPPPLPPPPPPPQEPDQLHLGATSVSSLQP
ncbi:zinc-finger homeodomain protein 6-like [Canna indica]|uniref:Zinc-finger homeodomain protein 6-like n=1 Tax=Canna indica TaxID=4628 RepID=A0AAQ3Q4E6_9LILI|nr:zinc-finger homeodomain protein 6-like [Canna indica]